MKNIIQNTTTWQQQVKIFFDKNYGWILLLTGLLAFILVERGQFFDEMMIGWNKGCKDCDDSMDGPLSIIFPLIFTIILLGVFIYGIGEIFYHIFSNIFFKKEIHCT